MVVDPVPGGALYIVSTPIGNLGDLTRRADEVLRAVSVILAEDTRHTRVLLDRYGIATPMRAYHEHVEARETPRIVEALLAGESFALVSDAGTPLLSDPGARLVRAVVEAGVRVVPVPGASALLAALVGAGLDATRFTFYGFPPRKGKERGELLDEIAGLRHTAVLYEAPGRVADTLSELAARERAGERPAVVARELTKQFEEFRRGTVAELAAYYAEHPPRGEVVLLVGAAAVEAADEDAVRRRARELAGDGRSTKEIVATLVAELGVPRNEAYRVAQEER